MSTNQFTFVCPVFNARTKFQSCSTLRNLVWAGKNPSVRRGCQVCMAAGKCPAAAAISKVIYDKTSSFDSFYSETEVNGKLPADVLERIRPVIVLDQHIQRFRPPTEEIELIQSANLRIDQQLLTAPKPAKSTTVRSSQAMKLTGSARKKSAAPAPAPTRAPKPTPNPHTAAATGDLAAAIN